MMIAFILGLVEGITEYLPISSTGHLIVAGHLLGFTGDKAGTFEIFIQMGAILAVLVMYPSRFAGFLDFKNNDGLRGTRGLSLLAVTTLPAVVLGLGLHSFIKHHLFSPLTVAIGFVAGALWILYAERRSAKPGTITVDRISWKEAFGIGCFQCLALWPGFSRSGATILGGMAMGLERKSAAEYSFFAAVPVLTAAALLDLVKSLHELQPSDFPMFGVGLLVSFIAACIVIRYFITFLQKHSMTAFAWYRFIAAGIIFYILR